MNVRQLAHESFQLLISTLTFPPFQSEKKKQIARGEGCTSATLRTLTSDLEGATAGHALILTDVLQTRELVHPQVEVQVQKPHTTDLGSNLVLELVSGRGVHFDYHVLDGFVVDAGDGEVLQRSQFQASSHPLLLAVRQRAETLDDVALHPGQSLKTCMVSGVHGGRRSLHHPQIQLVCLLVRGYSLLGGVCEF